MSAEKLAEALREIKEGFEVCDWTCERCGKDPGMRGTDVYHACVDALAAHAAEQADGAQARTWRCSVERHQGDGGVWFDTQYATSAPEMVIFKDRGYTCIEITEQAHPQPSVWQPIETAPQEEDILVGHYFDAKALGVERTESSRWLWITQGSFESGVFYEAFNDTDRPIEKMIYHHTMTHWMPLPAAPRERT